MLSHAEAVVQWEKSGTEPDLSLFRAECVPVSVPSTEAHCLVSMGSQ